MATIEARLQASNLARLFPPEILLPSQVPGSGAETPLQRLAMACLYDVVRLADKFAQKKAAGAKISQWMWEQHLQDRAWVNDDAPASFSFSDCIDILTPGERVDSISLQLWRRRLNAVLSGQVPGRIHRMSPRGARHSSGPLRLPKERVYQRERNGNSRDGGHRGG